MPCSRKSTLRLRRFHFASFGRGRADRLFNESLITDHYGRGAGVGRGLGVGGVLGVGVGLGVGVVVAVGVAVAVAVAEGLAVGVGVGLTAPDRG